MRGRRGRRLIPAALLAAVLLCAAAAGGSSAAALDALARVRLTVEIARVVDGLPVDALLARLTGRLQRAVPPILAEAGAVDHLRLRVALERRSATELRGFWLPFSGTYAIGLVELAVERPVCGPGAGALTTAIVWRQDRVVAVPWRAAADEVERATDAMLDAFLTARAGS